MSLSPHQVIFAIIAIGAVLYQAFVTVRLFRFDGYSAGQKRAQSFLIWLLPVLGAWVVHLVIRTTERPLPTADRNFIPQNPQSIDARLGR
jgi:hypothetical protein